MAFLADSIERGLHRCLMLVIIMELMCNSVGCASKRSSVTPNKFRPEVNTMSKSGFITSFDGTRLFYRRWERAHDKASGGSSKVVLILHGIGFHSGPYEVVANYLCPKGYIVYGLDARGHGLSQGKRGVLENESTIIRDIHIMIGFLKEEHPDKDIFLLGESMGGIFALAYSVQHSDALSGLILVAPGLSIHKSQLFSLDTLLLPFYLLFFRNASVISLAGSRLESSSRDQEFKKRRAEDPLSLHKVSPKYLMVLSKLTKNWVSRYPEKINMPTLIIHGLQDKVLDPRSSRKLYEHLASKDRKLKTFPLAYHTLFWDPDTPQVLRTIADWLEEH